ncbi:MAG: transporter substrate-binding domain-containing protein [Myxococcota bacterium]
MLAFLYPRASLAEAGDGAPGSLRVGTSGDYAPFSTLDPTGRRAGFDVDLVRAWAGSRGLRIEWVPFRWPELAGDLAAGRFDVAVGGITVRPERSAAGRFSLPLAESGAVVLVPESSGLDLDGLDSPTVRLAVNAGGHLERATRARFPGARVVAVPDNARVLSALAEGACDAVVTDTREAGSWRARWTREQTGALAQIGPFTRDRKAWWWRPGALTLARELDRWLLAQEAAGELARLRARHFGASDARPTAHPWPALAAALDERLSLMPAVAAVKRRDGLPIEVPEVEARVIAAGRRSIDREAAALGRNPPAAGRSDAVYRAFIEAAKAVQRATPDETPATLELDAIRPALLRIGDKLAFLLVRLPGPAAPDSEAAMAEALARETALGELAPAHARETARALHALSDARAGATPSPRP